MKIDLDELERKARAAKYVSNITRYFVRAGWPMLVAWSHTIDSEDTCVPQSYAECFRAVDAEHIAANSPPVTLALLARIRELEDFARHVIRDHVRDVDETEMHKVLEKGVTIP